MRAQPIKGSTIYRCWYQLRIDEGYILILKNDMKGSGKLGVAVFSGHNGAHVFSSSPGSSGWILQRLHLAAAVWLRDRNDIEM